MDITTARELAEREAAGGKINPPALDGGNLDEDGVDDSGNDEADQDED